MIRSHQLVYRYPQGPALVFPDVDVPQGSVLLLGGPPGAGKASWLALAAGLVRATAGQIEIAGQSLAAGNAVRKKAPPWMRGAPKPSASCRKNCT